LKTFLTNKEIDAKCYNVPSQKKIAAVESLDPSQGFMFQVTSAEQYPIKGRHLALLKKYFDLWRQTHKMIESD
jgi:hypothetical protein